MRTQILLIEDDQPIRDGVTDALDAAGFSVVSAETGEAGLELFHRGGFDLLLLDVVLPGQDGLAVLSQIREHQPGFPVILLTAKGAVEDRVDGLRLGADDYVVKPFNVRELLARVDAVLRRSPQRVGTTDSAEIDSQCVADFESRELRSESETVGLSEREADLLRYLITHIGRPVSRDELIEHVWNLNPRGLQTRTVDVHVGRLREKLATVTSLSQVKTLRGRGYVFERRS